MASISKFSTALLSVPNEVTVAAANFNLNFSLMKVEAPHEFHGLRDALSPTRRHEAEEGLLHVTARCLGALFDPLIPSIPHLTAAYGERVSEISNHIKPTSSPAGMFVDQAGADGTSIWAAATSGQPAIAMHLLSCMLARIWKPAEATSLWVELVERRKQEILKAHSAFSATEISSIMAAQQIFSRKQLSAWDASARAWLQSADSVKRVQQTQFMLIINNLRMPVNTNKEPYESIISAWTSGMNTMERLISGSPQRVQDGAILLAISSWHLYSNMQILSDQEKSISPGDKLMARSMLTVSTFGANNDREGVYWSLPLARLQYYSPPIVSERSIASDTSRISMEEFQIVCLGAFVAQWKYVCNSELRCCNLINRLQESYQRSSCRPPPWFTMLAAAASRVTNSIGSLQEQYYKLLRLGSRRCKAFLHEPEYQPPALFALVHFHVLLRALKDEEQRFRFLRHVAKSRGVRAEETVIRYKRYDARFGESYQYTSVLPLERSSSKRSSNQIETRSAGHQRFAIGRRPEKDPNIGCWGESICGCLDPDNESCPCKENGVGCTAECHSASENCLPLYPSLLMECEKAVCSLEHPCAGCFNIFQLRSTEAEGEEHSVLPPESLEFIDEYQFNLRKPGEEKMSLYG